MFAKDRTQINTTQVEYQRFLLAVSTTGVFLIAFGVIRTLQVSADLVFLLLLALVIFASIFATSDVAGGKTQFTYDVGIPVSLAALPLYGLHGAILLCAAIATTSWITKPRNQTTWKRTTQQLLFNNGLLSLSIVAASLVYLLIGDLAADNELYAVLAWLCAALSYELTNATLLISVVHLQSNRKHSIRELWDDHSSGSAISIVINFVGSAFVGYAIAQYGWRGTIIFYVPVLLSAWAFLVHIRKRSEHMDNLESIISERTSELEAANREKDAFLAMLTHDMKAPLTSILMYTTLLQSRPHLAASKPQMLGNILNAQHLLQGLVEDILDLERIANDGILPSDEREFELAGTISQVIEALRPTANNKPVTLEIDFGRDPTTVMGDPRLLNRVFTNLLSNAIKYTPAEGSVCVALYCRDSWVQIDFIDTGYGIPSESLPLIFERFHRVPSHRDKATGLGLGLSIAKAIVEQHKGTINVTSQIDQGSTFSVRLPLYAE